MSATTSAIRGAPVQESDLDDIEAYIATFDEDERRRLAAAEAAIDIAILLYPARERRGLSQAAAAKLAGLQQQAVSRFEQPDANPRLETIQEYLGALGYALELTAIDTETGEKTAKVLLTPTSVRSVADSK
jgi:DNA-binding XRE family transcriptional regulator